MKLFHVFMISLFLSTPLLAEEVIIDSKIKMVTVFLKGAQVNREAKFSMNSGIHQIIVSGVSQHVDPQSIQIKGSNGIIILNSKFTSYYHTPDKGVASKLPKSVQLKINSVKDSLAQVAFDLANLNSELEVLNASKSIILGNGAMRGQGSVNDSIQLLKEAVEYYLSKVKSLNREINEISRERRLKTLQQGSLQTRLNELKNYSNNDVFQKSNNKTEYRIVVTISSDKSTSAQLNLSYLVSNAGWNAQYDLRSKLESSTINLNYKAQVYQNTGVDWKDVKLSVSTNDPYKNKTKPELIPWVLGVQPYAHNQRLAQPNQAQILSEVVVKKKDSQFERKSVEERNFDYSTSAQHSQVVQHLISAEFRIDLPYSIKSNGEKHMVLVKNEDVEANYVYYTVPKIENSAYLVAQITNLEELQLIPAKATIFFDGSYMGETYINPTTMDDTLSLSLGKDPNIIVKRTFMNKKYKEKIIGSEVEKTSLYQLEILNNKSKSIHIIVQDQVPISRKDGIEITAEEISNGNLNSTTGTIEWKLELKSKERETLDLKYKVKHNEKEALVVR